jgi:hypothetical protein
MHSILHFSVHVSFLYLYTTKKIRAWFHGNRNSNACRVISDTGQLWKTTVSVHVDSVSMPCHEILHDAQPRRIYGGKKQIQSSLDIYLSQDFVKIWCFALGLRLCTEVCACSRTSIRDMHGVGGCLWAPRNDLIHSKNHSGMRYIAVETWEYYVGTIITFRLHVNAPQRGIDIQDTGNKRTIW